jgi:hypothetical protein
MPPEIHIYSRLPLAQSRGDLDARRDLEDDIEDRFETQIEVTGGGQGEGGWNIDLRLLDEYADVHRFAEELVKFLQEWGVPRDTFLNVFTRDWANGKKPARVQVYDGPAGQ